MSYIKSLQIDKNNAGQIIGGIHSAIVNTVNCKWRGAIWSNEMLIDLINECEDAGLGNWEKFRLTNDSAIAQMNTDDLISGNDFILASVNDSALAALYLYKVKSSAERGIDFTLTLNDLKKIISKKTCYFTGRRFVNDSASIDKITLDRLDNSLGYTRENTVACCYWVNQMKNELFENPRRPYKVSAKDLGKLVNKMIEIEVKKPKVKTK